MVDILYNKILLTLTNFGILVFLLMLMLDHYSANYNMQSWSTLFHCFCVVWLIFRGLFWLCTIVSDEAWSAMQFHTLYWLPNAFEFAAFSLLPMFFAQLLYTQIWKKYSKVIKPIYIFFICTIFSLQILWAIMAGLNTKCVQNRISGMHPVATNHKIYHSLPEKSTLVSNSIMGHIEGMTFETNGGKELAGQSDLNTLNALHNFRSSMSTKLWESKRDTRLPWTQSRQEDDKYSHEHRRGKAHHRDAADVYYEDCYGTDFSSAASRLLASVLFIALGCTQAIYGYKILHLPMQQYAQYFTAPLIIMNAVNAVLTICFATRGFYLFGTLLGLNMLPAIPLQYDKDIALSVLFCFELWDYIPILLLLLSVTSRPIGSGSLSLQGYISLEETSENTLYSGYARGVANGTYGDNYGSVEGLAGKYRSGGMRGNSTGSGGDGTGTSRQDGWRAFFNFSNRGDSNRSRSDGDDELSSGRTSRSGSMTVGGRSSRSGTFDRPRGMGGATRALDQLEIEIQSDMHNLQSPRGQLLIPAMGSLERFAAPSSLEPPKSWLTADRMAFEMTAQHLQQSNGSLSASMSVVGGTGTSVTRLSGGISVGTGTNSSAGNGHGEDYLDKPSQIRQSGSLLGYQPNSYQSQGGVNINAATSQSMRPNNQGAGKAFTSRSGKQKSTSSARAFDIGNSVGVIGSGDNTPGSIAANNTDTNSGSLPRGSSMRSDLKSRSGSSVVTSADALEIAQSDRVSILQDRQMRRMRGGSDLGVSSPGQMRADSPIGRGSVSQSPLLSVHGVNLSHSTSRLLKKNQGGGDNSKEAE